MDNKEKGTIFLFLSCVIIGILFGYTLGERYSCESGGGKIVEHTCYNVKIIEHDPLCGSYRLPAFPIKVQDKLNPNDTGVIEVNKEYYADIWTFRNISNQ